LPGTAQTKLSVLADTSTRSSQGAHEALDQEFDRRQATGARAFEFAGRKPMMLYFPAAPSRCD